MVQLHADTEEWAARLVSLAASLTGFMQGATGPAPEGWYAPGRDNSAFLHALDAAMAARDMHPALRAVRLYTGLLWQPVYLAVIGVYLGDGLPDLGGIAQERKGVFVSGFRMVATTPAGGSTRDMIAWCGPQLRDFADTLLAEVNAHEKLRPLPAHRLLAERLLSLLIWVSQFDSALSVDVVEDHAVQWLDALQIAGQATLQRVAGGHGETRLIVKRRGCCLDYLAEPFCVCASCPRQDNDVRIARQSNDSSG